MPKRRANGEGSIYPRKDKAGKITGWAAQYSDYTGKKRYLYGKTQKEVKEKLKEAIQNSDKGVVVQAKNIKFGDWMAEWLEVYAKPQIRGGTYEAYRTEVHFHIIPAFPGLYLKDIREDMLQKFLNDKLESRKDGKPGGYSRSVVNSLRIRLYSALEKATDLGFIPRNPARKLKTPKSEPQKRKALTPQEQKKLEARLRVELQHNYALPTIFLLLLNTGLRVGEAIGIQIDDIDFEKSELHVRRSVGRQYVSFDDNVEFGGKTLKMADSPKTSTSARTIPMSSMVADLLHAAIEGRAAHVERCAERWKKRVRHDPMWLEQGYLFLTNFGNAYDQSQLRVILLDISEEIGITFVGVHALRHTFATRWLEQGLDVKTLADILGHADARMTLNVYTHSLPEQKRNSMERFSGLMNGGADTDEDEAEKEEKR